MGLNLSWGGGRDPPIPSRGDAFASGSILTFSVGTLKLSKNTLVNCDGRQRPNIFLYEILWKESEFNGESYRERYILLTYVYRSETFAFQWKWGCLLMYTRHRRSSTMLYQGEMNDRVCKDHPLEPQPSFTPFGVLNSVQLFLNSISLYSYQKQSS